MLCFVFSFCDNYIVLSNEVKTSIHKTPHILCYDVLLSIQNRPQQRALNGMRILNRQRREALPAFMLN